MSLKTPRLRIVPAVDSVHVDLKLDPFLTLKALAQYVGLSPRSLRAHVHAVVAPLPAYRIGARLVFRVSEVDRWMAARRVQPDVDVKALVDDVVKNVLKRPRTPKGEPR